MVNPMAMVTKTTKPGVYTATKRQAIIGTQTLCNRVIASHMGFFADHLMIFDEKVPHASKRTENRASLTTPLLTTHYRQRPVLEC